MSGLSVSRRLERIRDLTASRRESLHEWVNRSDARLKLLHAIASRRRQGIDYATLEACTGTTRRWVKELVGELRSLGIIETPGNPAVARPQTFRSYVLICDFLTHLLPSEQNLASHSATQASSQQQDGPSSGGAYGGEVSSPPSGISGGKSPPG